MNKRALLDTAKALLAQGRGILAMDESNSTRNGRFTSAGIVQTVQHPALGIWAGQDANRAAAQQALLKRARCNRAALRGGYSAAMETA